MSAQIMWNKFVHISISAIGQNDLEKHQILAKIQYHASLALNHYIMVFNNNTNLTSFLHL